MGCITQATSKKHANCKTTRLYQINPYSYDETKGFEGVLGHLPQSHGCLSQQLELVFQLDDCEMFVNFVRELVNVAGDWYLAISNKS